MSTSRIYLDANATTAPSEAVRAAIATTQAEAWGNASSLHDSGRGAARVLSAARADVARLASASATEVVFTSGGTEADRLGVLGALRARPGRRHVVCSAIEHPAVRDLLRDWAKSPWGEGLEVTFVRPDEHGAVSAEDVAAALRDDTVLVALMWANNETGVVQPIAEVAAHCRAAQAAFLVDAVQAAGKFPIDMGAAGVDLLAISAHKMHGPKGIGALYVRRGAHWVAPFAAKHEQSRRGGTEPVALAAGMAAAAREAVADLELHAARMSELRDRFERVVCGALGDVRVNGSGARTPNTSNLEFHGVDGERLLAVLDRAGVDASNGSACSAATTEPSHVLLAMGRRRREALSALRFSLSKTTTSDEIDRAAGAVIESVETLRKRR